MDRKHSVQSLWKVLIPVILIAVFSIYNMVKMEQAGDSLVWQHYTAIAGFVVIIALLFINRYYGLLATGIFILLAIINVISISYGIFHIWWRIGPVIIPLGQPLGWLLLIVFAIFHLESLYNDYLDNKEEQER